MFPRFKKFCRDDHGAVTVDWVVLTAAIVALAGLATVSVRSSSNTLAAEAGTYLDGIEAGNQ
jgi:Flp pilus assembly pilin Flp